MLPNCPVRTEIPQPTAACPVLLVSSRCHTSPPSLPLPSCSLPAALLQRWAQPSGAVAGKEGGGGTGPSWCHSCPHCVLLCLCPCAPVPGSGVLRAGGALWRCHSGGGTCWSHPGREGTACLQPCSRPLKGCSCLCSAAERDLGFFPLRDPLGLLVLTPFPRKILEELLLILPFSLNSFDFPFLRPVDDCFAPTLHCKPVATSCPFREQLSWQLLCP